MSLKARSICTAVRCCMASFVFPASTTRGPRLPLVCPGANPSAAARGLLAVAGGQARRKNVGLPRLLGDERVAQSRECSAERFARLPEPVEQRRGGARQLAINHFERLASGDRQGEAHLAAV